MQRSWLTCLLLCLSLGVALPASVRAQGSGKPAFGTDGRVGNRCLDCHAGIESINEAMDRSWHAGTDCLTCHKGNGSGRTIEDAHRGLIAKPGDLRVVQQTCGACHSTQGPLAPGFPMPWGNDHVDRVLRSPMTLATGEIAVLRYLWGEQSTPRALYGVRSISSLYDEPQPGVVSAVAELPDAKNSPADHLLRTRCLQCHLWSTPDADKPPFRGAGCAACHVPYAADGRSRSADPTISKTEPGHPALHRIERYTPNQQCLTCHRDEGLGIGWNFVGWVSPHADGTASTPQEARALPVTPDVHAAAGMSCIDCHDSTDVHGDGMVHSRGRTAVGVSCISCHGTTESPPTFRTSRGDVLANVQVGEAGPVLTTKVGKEALLIPVLNTQPVQERPEAHRIPGHGSPLESGGGVSCVACHSGDTAQHYVRHFALDERQAVLDDWVEGHEPNAPPTVIPGRWSITNTWSPVRPPMIGVRDDTETYPLLPTVHAVRSLTDATGREVEHRSLLSTAEGHYGIGVQTADPHRTTRSARTCVSCHGDTAALGQGSSSIDGLRLGWPLRYAPDQVADAEGTAIAAFTSDGDRPLNYTELQRVVRGPACIECHVDAAPRGPLPEAHPPVEADKRHAEQIAARTPVPLAEPTSEEHLSTVLEDMNGEERATETDTEQSKRTEPRNMNGVQRDSEDDEIGRKLSPQIGR